MFIKYQKSIEFRMLSYMGCVKSMRANQLAAFVSPVSALIYLGLQTLPGIASCNFPQSQNLWSLRIARSQTFKMAMIFTR